MKHSTLALILRGAAMGVAEVIPGVSGGTIAFITGIYDRLIDSIKSFDLKFLNHLLKGQFRAAFKQIDLLFLVKLLSGMVLGILSGIFFISHLLETKPELLWSAFFALILASLPLMYRSLRHPHWIHLIYFLSGTVMAFLITSLTPVTASENGIYIFFGGMIAIVALVLPGISGSFILLLMGLYTLIIPTLKSFLSSPETSELWIILQFAAGCIIGLLVFSRIVSAAFKRYHDLTVAVMSGFMLGSLNKIWPWRNPEIILSKETGQKLDYNPELLTAADLHSGDYKLIYETNVWPSDYYEEPKLMAVLLVFFLSVLIVFALSKYARNL